MADVELLPAFKFEIALTRSNFTGNTSPQLGNGAFAECSGLELEADVREYLEGGRNDAVTRRVGRVKLVPLVLKRGMFVPSSGGTANGELWRWLSGMVSGQLPIPRYDGIITIFDPTTTRMLAQWSFDRGLPLKVVGPSLNAKTGEIAIEELHIAHQGLILGPRPTTSASLVKAELWPLKEVAGQERGAPNRLIPDKKDTRIYVQFNPTSLKIEHQNNVDRGGVTTQTQRRQWNASEAATLSFDLEFDTAESAGNDGKPQDVRDLTGKIRDFIEPPHNDKTGTKTSDPPPRVRFLWGKFSFVGIVRHLSEDLDYFSAEGVPLRAKVSLSITEQNLKFENLETGSGARDAKNATNPGGGMVQTGPGSSPTANPILAALAQAGESMQQLLSRLDALPQAWRSAMAGLDSPLNLPAGQQVQLGPEAFGGGDVGVSTGFAVGTDASMTASLAGALGVDASVSASVSASVAVPGAPAVAVSAGASAEATAGFALSAGGGVAASLNTVLAGEVTASVTQARALFEVPGASAASDATVDVRALSYGRSIPLRARADTATVVAAAAGGRPNLSARAASGEVPLASGAGVAPWQQLPPSTPERSSADAQQRRRDAGPDTMRWTPGR